MSLATHLGYQRHAGQIFDNRSRLPKCDKGSWEVHTARGENSRFATQTGSIPIYERRGPGWKRK